MSEEQAALAAQRLWLALQQHTYMQRTNGLKYMPNDPNRSQAFHLYATKFELGVPLAPSQQLSHGGRTYCYQTFAGDTIFNEGQKWSEVQSLNSMLSNAIPEDGLSRMLLEGSYRHSLAASAARVPLRGNQQFHDDWRFHYIAMRERLGPALSGNYVTDDRQYAVQVFACDTLYTSMSDQAGCKLLSQAAPDDPEYQLMWTETYKISSTPYDPNSSFQQLAVQAELGTPLSGITSVAVDGTSYQVQVFARDTLYAAPDGAVQRLSALPKPPDVLAWQPKPVAPAAALPPKPATAPAVMLVSKAVRDMNWPPRPNFYPLQSDKARMEAFGTFTYIRARGDNIQIQGDWPQNNIVKITIPQLASVKGANGSTIQVHKRVAEQLCGLWAAWEAAGLLHHVRTWAGSYVPRFMRGSKQLSTHAFGCAFDINVEWNGYYKVAALVGDEGCVRELVPLANEHGFYWGGHFPYGKGLSDGMHFEWAVSR